MKDPTHQSGPTPQQLAAAYPYQPAPPRKSRWVLWTSLGCGGAVLVLAICGGGIVFLLWQGKSSVEPAVNEFLAKLDRQDYTAAYASIGREWKAIQKEQAFTEFETRIRELLGPPQSKSTRGFQINTTPQGGKAVMTYAVTYAKGSGTMTITLSKEGGAWKVIGHRVDSPSLLQALKCPKCGRVNQALGKFCSNCGAAMP